MRISPNLNTRPSRPASTLRKRPQTHAWRSHGHCLWADKRSSCATQAMFACLPQPDPDHHHHGFAGRTRGPRTLTRQHPQKTPLAIHLVSFTLFPFHSNHGSQHSEVRKLQMTLVASMHFANGMKNLERAKNDNVPSVELVFNLQIAN